MGNQREPGVSRVRTAAHAVVVALVMLALLLSGPAPAVAAPSIDYPSWADVTAARSNEAKAKAQIAAIQALLAKLQSDLEQAQADEIAKGTAYAEAQDAYDAQVLVADDLAAQAEAARADADAAKEQANRLLAMLAKSANGDLAAQLFADSQGADALLYRLEAMDRLSEQSDRVYAGALQLQNTSEALSEQADIAEQKREELREAAEKALDEARKATEAVNAAIAEQQDHQAELEAQLEVLVQKRQATEADYQAGVVAREKARLAALAAAAAAAANAGSVNGYGWARPSAGYISSSFGNRYHPIYHYWKLHSGTDIAGQGCGAPIYAAHSGTVNYAGWNGDLGNYVQINHGDGTSSGYGHIISGGILVGYGQWVSAGQQIARVGSTGGSTGCHLHFIIRINGQLTDPVPFMANRGIRLG
jgi:murein DD-endopeptidase MepM/ murein hydrolase activator NlpD